MLVDDLYQGIIDLLCDQRTSRWLHPLLLLGDAALTFLIIQRVACEYG